MCGVGWRGGGCGGRWMRLKTLRSLTVCFLLVFVFLGGSVVAVLVYALRQPPPPPPPSHSPPTPCPLPPNHSPPRIHPLDVQ